MLVAVHAPPAREEMPRALGRPRGDRVFPRERGGCLSSSHWGRGRLCPLHSVELSGVVFRGPHSRTGRVGFEPRSVDSPSTSRLSLHSRVKQFQPRPLCCPQGPRLTCRGLLTASCRLAPGGNGRHGLALRPPHPACFSTALRSDVSQLAACFLAPVPSALLRFSSSP